MPWEYTPEYRFRHTIGVIIYIQELKTLKLPYSSVVKTRVKIGVVMVDMPFCKKEHTKKTIEAFT